MALSKQKRLLLSLAFFSLVGAGAGAFAWFGVFKAEEAETQRKEAEAKAFTFDRKAVKKVSLLSRGVQFQFERDGFNWRMTAPIQTFADRYGVEDMLDKLQQLKIRSTAADDRARAVEFGLDAPRFKLQAELDGGRTLTLDVGADSTFDSGIYFTRDGDGRVLVAESGLAGPFDKDLFGLRHRGLMYVERSTITALASEVSGAGFALEKDGSNWKLTSPVQEKADFLAVDSLLGSLYSTRASAVVLEAAAASQPGALAPYGLDQPVALFTVTSGDDKKKTVIAMGEVETEGAKKLYARPGDGPVLELDPSARLAIHKPLAELRDKAVTFFSRDDVQGVEITPEIGPVIKVDRVVPTPETPEKFTVNGKKDKLDREKLSALVSTLCAMRAAAVVPDPLGELSTYGLEKPRMRVKVTGAQGKPVVELLVGAAKDGKSFVKRGDAPQIYEVEDGVLAALPTSAADLDAPIRPPEAAK